jgi:hypothetical protein
MNNYSYIEKYNIVFTTEFINIKGLGATYIAINRENVTKITADETSLVIKTKGGWLTFYNTETLSNHIYLR